MNDITYNVRIYKTDVYESRRKNGRNTYWVRWKVGKAVFKLPYGTSALAESFRSELMTAARKSEAFRVSDGMPVSKMRTENQRSWYIFACSYVDLKWKAAAATYRRGIAEAMVTLTMAMLTEERGRPPDDKAIRSALFRWAFNTPHRSSEEIPQDVAEILQWGRGKHASCWRSRG
jgi:hypothetical protein